MREPMRHPTYLLERNRAFLPFSIPLFFYLSLPALRNCSLMPVLVYSEGASTRIESFLSSPPFSSGRVPRKRKEKKEKQNDNEGWELREESEARRGGSRTCVCLRETGSGYGPGWTDGWTNGETVTAGLKWERERGTREACATGSDESSDRCDGTTAINPPLDERRCFCDLRSATIFAHSFYAIGVTGCLSRCDAEKE